jgi:hypothetical protein
MVKTTLSEEKSKAQLDMYNRPQNCENLVRRTFTKTRDLKMQNLENTLLMEQHDIYD